MPLGRAMNLTVCYLKSKRVEVKEDKMKMPAIERQEVE